MHSLTILLAFATLAAARTDISGCVSTATRDQYNEASLLWYVPGTGEVCAFLDCGGGRAPPITTQPGCDGYKGTATYSPQYITLKAATVTSVSASGSTTQSGAATTVSASKEAPVSTPSGFATSTSGAAAQGLASSTLPFVTTGSASASVSGSAAPSESSGAGSPSSAASGGSNSSVSTTGSAGGAATSTPSTANALVVNGLIAILAAIFALFL